MSLNFDSNTEPVTDKHLKINTKGVEPNKGRRSNTDPVIGIDLGTTFSSVGICKNNKVEIIVNEYGNRTTPSYVSFDENGQRLIGDGAKNQLVKNSSNTIFDVKRLMGREWNDEFVQNDKEHFPFPVVEKNSRPHIEIQNKNGPKVFSPEEISAMLLKKLAKMAQEYLGQDVKDVVITVPAYFNDAQRQATKNAGTIAGLNVLKILNEPTAAAMAYALNTNQNDKIILLFDLGGGTLDVSIMSIKDTVFTVLATCGNMHLGGEDFDQNVINYFIKLYQTEKGKDFSTNTKAIQKLRREVEKAKRVLTYHSSTIIDIEEFLEDEDFSEILTKEKFEELNKDLFESTLEPLKQALDDAQLKKTHIDEIVMVGGSSRIPKIRELVKDFFDGKEPFQKINPDEAVASGAAIQAGILSGQQDSVILLDVNPLSIGVETFDKTLSVIIPRNTSIPTKVTSSRTTVADYQKCIRYSVYEGELPVAKDNLLLGEFIISNIQFALAGVPDILLTMEIDEDGILHTTAEDQETNSKNDIFINYAKNRLSQEEITEMMKVLEEYDRLEEKYYQSVKARIEFTEAIYRYRNSFDYLNVTDLEKENLTKLVEENLQWLKDNKICQIEEYKERKLLFEKVTDNSFDQNTIEE